MKTILSAVFPLFSFIFPALAGDLNLTAFRQAWDAEEATIARDIEANRTGLMTLTIVDEKGEPIPNAEISVKQFSHDFYFGCNALVLGQLASISYKRDYENAICHLFNLVTTTLCPGVYLNKDGSCRFEDNGDETPRRPPPDRVVRWCCEKGLACKGQPLLAGSWHPKWAMDLTHSEALELYKNYFQKVAERYDDKFAIIDVVNEAFCHKKFPLYSDDLKFVEEAFSLAAPLFPTNVQLCLNEYSAVNGPITDFHGYFDKSGDYYDLAKRLLDKKIRLDALGFQFHIFSNHEMTDLLTLKRWAPSDLRKTYAKYATLGLPLYITEITIPSTLGAAGITGEALQAEVARKFYRFWFSQKAFNGVTWWNLCDGAAWKNEGKVLAGLLDAEMREKPAYQTLYQLIQREWTTRTGGRTKADGTYSFRGYTGEYVVTVSAPNGAGRSFTFPLTTGTAEKTLRVTPLKSANE